MLRRRLISSCLVATGIAGLGCARELELDPNPIDPNNLGVVVAQFDPTNRVPVLRLVPSPTAIAQNPDGTINYDRVKPEPCELPDTAQCLQFVDGWPITTPITVYFSGDVDGTTIRSGIKLFEASATGLAPVEFDPICPSSATGQCADPSRPYEARPLPPAACQMDGGSLRYTLDGSDPTLPRVPPGIQVVLRPRTPLKPRTNYLLMLESTDAAGLKASDGTRIDPSGLFSLLNVDVEPVDASGNITGAILRSQAQGTLLRNEFNGKAATALDDSERALFQQRLNETGLQLRGLYTLFKGVGDTLMAAGQLAKREDAVYLNTWTTGGDPTVAEFDPANDKFPFPNVPLMTTSSPAHTLMNLQVYLPPDPADSPTAAALKLGLNTLDGFSNTAPTAITFSKNIDADTLAGNILFVEVDDQDAIQGEVPISVTYTASSAFGAASIAIRPLAPLKQDQRYLVALARGIQDEAGNEVAIASTMRLLRNVSDPFITGTTVNPAVEQALQCSTVQTTGRLADDSTVVGLATALETQVSHARWTMAFDALDGATIGAETIARDDLLMAFHYKTQSITTTVDAAKNVLLPNVWEQLDPGPRMVGPVFTATGTAEIADLIGIIPLFCVGFCEAGAMAPDIMPGECATYDAEGNITDVNPAVPGNLVCQLAHQVIAGNLGAASLYLMRAYRSTSGNPYSAGTFTPNTVMQPDVIDLPVWVITPASAPPPEGYPVVIFQHGLGQEKENGFLLANTLANTTPGWATVMVDFPFHGARASDLIDNTTMAPCVDANMVPNIDPADVLCDSQSGMCQNGCDGLQDPSATGLLSPNLFGVRDNFRQGTIDQLTLLRAIQLEGAAAGALPALDGTRVAYIGQSLGGIAGGNFAAYATPNDLEALVVNVGGGSLTTILLNTVPQIAAPLYAALMRAGVCEFNTPGNPASGCKPTAAFRQFLLIAQWVLDPGDPHGTSIGVRGDDRPGLGADKVLIQMSKPDLVVANRSSFLLGTAYGRNLQVTSPAPFEFTSTDERFQIYDFTLCVDMNDDDIPGSRCTPSLACTDAAGAPIANARCKVPQAWDNPQTQEYETGCHGWLLGPICGELDAMGAPNLPDILCTTIGAQLQAAGFVASGGTNVPPQRPAQVAGIPCP
jgi:pimeloyl-ACP methyl ester carboxylesterase